MAKAASDRGAPADGTLMDAERIGKVLRRSPHARTMPGEVIDRLAALGRIERYQDGDLIHPAWRPVRKLWVVLSGALRVTEVNADGDALTTAVLGEGSYYAVGSLVGDGMLVKSEAHALGPTQLAAFELAQLEREFGDDKTVGKHRRLLLYLRFWALTDLYRDALVVPLPQRVARRLLSQALSAGRGRELELRLSQADLAAMLGASRSRVNAELRRLQHNGIVDLRYRRIVVRDLDLLRAAAGAGDVVPL